jgi:hypothetical protein
MIQERSETGKKKNSNKRQIEHGRLQALQLLLLVLVALEYLRRFFAHNFLIVQNLGYFSEYI